MRGSSMLMMMMMISTHRSDAELKEDLEYLHGALEKDSRDLRSVTHTCLLSQWEDR